MAKLYYQGHASFRITTSGNTVIYVDPYAGSGYDIPADIILISHEHFDHNKVSLVKTKADTKIIRAKDALRSGRYQKFSVKDVRIEAVPAYNKNHRRDECVGFVLHLDGISIYAAGDTSMTAAMSETLPEYHLDYALLPVDGIYNMDPKEATACAQMIGAKHSIPIHTKPGSLFDRKTAERFTASGRIIMKPGQEIEL